MERIYGSAALVVVTLLGPVHGAHADERETLYGISNGDEFGTGVADGRRRERRRSAGPRRRCAEEQCERQQLRGGADLLRDDFSLIWSWEGRIRDAWFGSSLAPAGDVDGDGYADVAVARRNSSGTAPNTGKSP